MQALYHVQDCLNLCVNLQTQYKRWGKELAIGELMRMAVLEEPSKSMVIALCRLLFVSKNERNLRPPALGEPWFLGETSEKQWPCQPIELYEGVPFFIVRGWTVAGMPEQANWYLASCLIDGAWNDNPFKTIDQEGLERIAEGFIENGPWKRRLTDGEKSFLLSQIEVKEKLPTVAS